MHVVVPQNLPISVQGFLEDSSSLQAFYFPSWDLSIFQRKHKPNLGVTKTKTYENEDLRPKTRS